MNDPQTCPHTTVAVKPDTYCESRVCLDCNAHLGVVQTKDDLKTVCCPFCGHKAYSKDGLQGILYFMCDGCGAVTSFRPNLSGAVALAAFNRRTVKV